MGAGASSLPRARKALLIRAYNIRPADQTLVDQFAPFAFRGSDMQLYIFPSQIQKALKMNSADYGWLADLLQTLFTHPPGVSGAKEKALKLFDFIHFLETGKLPLITAAQESERSNVALPDSSAPSTVSHSGDAGSLGASPGRRPPNPPNQQDRGRSFSPAAPATPSTLSDSKPSPLPSSPAFAHDEVIAIHLGRMGSQRLPSIVKIKDGYQPSEREPGLEVMILDPKTAGRPRGESGKQVWRKREVVRQERTVHYTTVDDQGATQELVEKEVTQSEVLHMECRDTGEFAHRESTIYEQLETFNDEVVNEVHGHEDYVHLKSLEDEFHYMDSDMPPKGDRDGAPPPRAASGGDAAADQAGEDPIYRECDEAGEGEEQEERRRAGHGEAPRSPTLREEVVREEDYAASHLAPSYSVEEPDESADPRAACDGNVSPNHPRQGAGDEHEDEGVGQFVCTDTELEAAGGITEQRMREMLQAVGVDPAGAELTPLPQAASYESLHEID